MKTIIKKKYGQDSCNVGDEGGFAPPVKDCEEALDVIMDAVKQAGYESKCKVTADMAAKEFHQEGKYNLDFKHDSGRAEMNKTVDEMVAYYKSLASKYPFASIEDPFSQDDEDPIEAYAKLYQDAGAELQIIGDNLVGTNYKRVLAMQELSGVSGRVSCNAMSLKVGAAGTVSETIKAAKAGSDNGWDMIVSHVSGETEDSFIADLAVGIRATSIKTGAPCRSERMAKYNQLLRIEEELGPQCWYGTPASSK